MEKIVERLLNGDRRALARLLTLIESGVPVARQYLAELHQHAGRAHIVGVTGAPGAGKSTLLEKIKTLYNAVPGLAPDKIRPTIGQNSG